jgi:hypothetical protein
MNDRAERMHAHIDHIEARLDCIKGIFAGNAVYDKWPMPREEYERVAERLESAAAIARQHIEAYDRLDLYEAEAKARWAASDERRAA